MTDFSTPRYVADFLLPHLVHTVSFTALLSSHPEEESAERSPHLFRPAVMGLYVERRCIRSGYASRIILQPSRQDMPNLPERKNGNEKAVGNQTRSCSQSTFFTIRTSFLLSVLLQENKKRDQPTASLQSVSPIQTVIITQR